MKKKAFVLLMVTTVVASMATGAYGATKLQEIKAYLNSGISIKANGVPVQLKDNNGSVVLPITYNNTTYLPLRSISDVLGVAVNYDAPNNMVHLGERVDGVAILKDFNDMYHTKDPAHTSYKNKDYKEVYYNNSDGNRSFSLMLKPNKKYQTLYLQVAAIDEPITELQFQDTKNNRVILKTVPEITPEDGLVTVEVNIGGVEEIYVHGDAKKSGKIFIPLTTSYYK